MSAWEDAFKELVRLAQPDVDPVLTYGAGTEPAEDKELDQILLASARGMVWKADEAVTYGQTIFPTARMGRRFKIIQAGQLGSTEPSWPGYDYAVVTDGTAMLVEDGSDGLSIYDVTRAAHEAWRLKASKASEYLKSADDDDSQIYQRCVEQAARYAPVSIA